MSELYSQLKKINQYTVIYSGIRQEKFNNFIGNASYSIDYNQGKIFFGQSNQAIPAEQSGAPVSANIHMLASIAVRPNTILWAYAPQYESIVPSDDIIHNLKKIGLEQDIAALATQEIEYPLDGGDQLIAIINAAHTVGQVGIRFFGVNDAKDALYYIYPVGESGSYQVVLMDGFNVEVPKIGIDDLLVYLPRYISNGAITDFELALEGLKVLGDFWVSIDKYSEPNGTIRYAAEIIELFSHNDDDIVIQLNFVKDSIGRVRNINMRTRRYGDPTGTVE